MHLEIQVEVDPDDPVRLGRLDRRGGVEDEIADLGPVSLRGQHPPFADDRHPELVARHRSASPWPG